MAADATRGQKARAQFRIGACYERLGLAEARRAYEAVVANYADQADLAAEAKARLAALAEPAGRSDSPVLRQVWTTSEGGTWHRISPNGGSAVGVDPQTGDLLTRSAATGEIRRLTAISKDRWWLDYADSPIWSRDGRQIAYNWEIWASHSSRGAAELRIADLAGGTSRVVPLDTRFRSAAPEAWSPDGRRVLARLEEGPPDYRRRHLAWVAASNGTVEVLVTAAAGRDLDPAFLSPDGAWIISRFPNDDKAFSILPARGGPLQTLIPATASDALIGWIADGTHVLYVSPGDDSKNLIAVRVVDGRAVDQPVVIRRMQAFGSLGVSQAGAFFYKITQEASTQVYRASFDRASGKVGPPSRVDVFEGRGNGSVSWSPDGRRLAYTSWPEGQPRRRTLSIWSAENAQTRSLSLPFDTSAAWTQWSADGRWVHVAGGDRRLGIFRVDTETGTTEAVVPPSAEVFVSKAPQTSVSFQAGWTPGGGIIYKNELSQRPQGRQGAIVAHRLSDHSERELFRSEVAQYVLGVTLSPDGGQLAFGLVDVTARTTTIMVMPAAGGPAKSLATLATTSIGCSGWTYDGRSFVCTTLHYKPMRPLLCDVTTGIVTPVTVASEPVLEAAVSPDGKEIAYVSLSRADRSVWMLENFLSNPKGPAPRK